MREVQDESANSIYLQASDLQAAPYDFKQSFKLALNHHDDLIVTEIWRMIPGKRMVAAAQWKGQAIVAKLFFDPVDARRHFEKEYTGLNNLHDLSIPAPKIVQTGSSADSRVYVILIERIVDAMSLEKIWKERKSVYEIFPILRAMMVELATQHVLGVMQQDLHFKNFLISARSDAILIKPGESGDDSVQQRIKRSDEAMIYIYSLDGADVKRCALLLEKKESINHLALFLAQMGAGSERYQQKLFAHYAQARGWRINKNDYLQALAEINKHQQVRARRYRKKMFRSSSDFMPIQSGGMQGMVQRAYASPEFLAFLADPERAFHDVHSVVLKQGRSATVVKMLLGPHQLVIKRYNIKNEWHGLRRWGRRSRAKKNWFFANQLELFSVRTPKPVAFIEKRVMGLALTSYYISEFIPGPDLGVFIHTLTDAKQQLMIYRTLQLFYALNAIGITHGDLKITNLLVDQENQPCLIDLDGAKVHRSECRLKQQAQKEWQRFLNNFKDQPKLQAKFIAAKLHYNK